MDPLQERLEDPDPMEEDRMMLGWLKVHARPVPGEIELDSVTVPANPFKPATPTVALPDVLLYTVTLFGLGVIVKS